MGANVRWCMPERILLFLLLIPGAGLCYEPERARNNLAHDFAECAAYYQLMGEQPRIDDAAKKNFSDVSASLMQLSVGLTSLKLAYARFEMALKTLTREMDNNWGNLSIVLNKYAYPCKDMVENPQARLQYWLDKKD